MIRSSVLLLLVSGVVLSAIPDDIEEFTLSNGINVIHRCLENNEVEGLSLFLTGGVTALSEETQGIEVFAIEAAMMGSGNFPGETWRELMDLTQAEWEGNYNYDFSRFHLRCLREDLPILLEAFGDCLLHPEFEENAVEQVRMRMLQELAQQYNDPDDRIWLVTNRIFLKGHPYSLRPDGLPETISSFSIEDLSYALEARIKAGNILLVHVGPTPAGELIELLEVAFSDIPEGGGEFPDPGPFLFSENGMEYEEQEVLTAFAVAKFEGPDNDHPDYPVFRVAMNVMSERFWQVLRTEHSLTYATFSGATAYRKNWGYLYVSSPRIAEACSLMAGVYTTMSTEPLDEEWVRGTINEWQTLQYMRESSRINQCWMLGQAQISTGDWRNAFTYLDSARDVTPEDIRDVLSRYGDSIAWGIIADPELVPAEQLSPWTITPSEGDIR